MSRTVTLYTSRDGLDVVVRATVTPGRPAKLYGEPADCHPAEDGDVSFTATIAGEPIVLTPEEEADLVDAALAQAEEDEEAEAAEWAERNAEERRDFRAMRGAL